VIHYARIIPGRCLVALPDTVISVAMGVNVNVLAALYKCAITLTLTLAPIATATVACIQPKNVVICLGMGNVCVVALMLLSTNTFIIINLVGGRESGSLQCDSHTPLTINGDPIRMANTMATS